MNEQNLSHRRSFLKRVGAGLGLGLVGPVGPLAFAGASRPGETSPKVRYRWVSVREVHGDGTHNAWPDICRWRDRYYVAFNSGGMNHGGGHGLLVLSSADGLKWETVLQKSAGEWGILANTTRTTVCPKFLPLKDRLILVFYFYTSGDMDVSPQRKADLKRRWLSLKGSEESFERWVQHHNTSFRTGVSYSEDGLRFEDPEPLLDPSWRVWRPQTFQGRHYIIGYRCHGQEWSFSPELESMIPEAHTFEMFESASLFSSADGLSWGKVSDIAAEDNDETDFDFAPDGRILAVSRKGASSKLHPGARPGSRHALAYLSHPPYRSWRRLPLDRMIQAPAVRWAKDRWMIAGRYIDGETEQVHPQRADYPHKAQRYGTRMWTLEDRTGALTQAVTLPSWGDCSYPGIIEEANGDLLVVYYSHSITTDSHQYIGGGLWPGKMPPASIYLARVVREEMG